MQLSGSSPDGQPASGQPLAPTRAVLVVAGIVALLAGYIALSYAFQIEAIFAGSFFVFAWVALEKAAPRALAATIVGAFGGMANASLLHASLAEAFGIDSGVAGLAGLGLLILALYLLLVQRLKLIVNQSYMLFLTVAAMPQLSEPKILFSMAESVLLSATYFGSVLWIGRRMLARRGPGAAAGAVTTE